ncbi:hypothetical protein DV515_00011540 [Chloebia gouldiae]|uniref:Uncharacterized protein n=1 Tax=Chloebia gouldiae TaxID=44316 RepID=A0A3L8S6N3_CHLGU|nr:hypothetical protein DV515_00011540 [Chloebia gouldiae]
MSGAGGNPCRPPRQQPPSPSNIQYGSAAEAEPKGERGRKGEGGQGEEGKRGRKKRKGRQEGGGGGDGRRQPSDLEQGKL